MSDVGFEKIPEQIPEKATPPEPAAEDNPPETGNDRWEETSPQVQSDAVLSPGFEPESTEDTASDDLILDEISQLCKRVSSLEKLFEAKILHTAHEEKILDQMHSELQKYKGDMYSQLVRPILLDMIEMRDSIMRVAAAHLDKPEGEQNIPLKTFSMYAYDAQEILEKNHIEIFKSDKDSKFIPVRQKAIKKIPTNDQELHGKIAESLSDGYNYNGKPISAEKVAVYYYEQPQAPAENIEEETQNG